MRYFFLLMMAVGCCGGGVLAEAPATPGPEELQGLVKQLGSRDFDEREDARLKLLDLGEAAREVLTEAVKDADLEISASAVRLLEKINRAVVAVRVVDSTEKPLAEVPVIFNLQLRDGRRTVSVLRSETVKTDADGWACVGDLKPCDGYILNVRYLMPNCVPAVISQQAMDLEAKRHEFKLVALRCATVSGTLLAKAEVPLAGCRLCLVPSNRFRLLKNANLARYATRNTPLTTTEKHGQFKFELVQPGEYAMAIVGEEGMRWKSDTVQVEAEEELRMGVLTTQVDIAVLKRDGDVLMGDEEDATAGK